MSEDRLDQQPSGRHSHAPGRHDVGWLLDEVGIRIAYSANYVGSHRKDTE